MICQTGAEVIRIVVLLEVTSLRLRLAPYRNHCITQAEAHIHSRSVYGHPRCQQYASPLKFAVRYPIGQKESPGAVGSELLLPVRIVITTIVVVAGGCQRQNEKS